MGADRAALESVGRLSDKILVDCTNPLKEDLSGLVIGHTSSAAEQVAQWADGAKVCKAFNQTGFENMAICDLDDCFNSEPYNALFSLPAETLY